METVTTAEIEAAFITKIRGIVPRYEPLRSVRWAHLDGVERRRGRADLLGHATRAYTLIFGVGTPTYLWTGDDGVAYACRAAVATSYAGVEPERLQHMLTADAVDLLDHLSQLRDGGPGTLKGLCDIRPLGLQAEEVDDLGNVYVEHVFTIHWHQASDA